MNQIQIVNKDTVHKLSIIIVSYNSVKYIDDCINSIIKYHEPKKNKSEIIVVDNASTDGSVDLVKNKYTDVKLILNKSNLGFSAANNIGIKLSQSEYVLLCNSDCEIFKDSINNLISFMDKHQSVGISGPKIINSDGTIQLSCRRFPSFFDAGMHSILEYIIPGNRFTRKYKLADVNRKKPFEVDWVSGSFMIIRRKAMLDTGLLDEKYFMYVEDIDLCYQMWKKGWQVYYNPYSRVLHHVGGSTHESKTTASIRMQKSIFHFYWKNYRKTYRIIFLPLVLIFLGLRILLTFIKNLLK